MGGHANADAVLSAGDQVIHVVRLGQNQGQRAGPKFCGESVKRVGNVARQGDGLDGTQASEPQMQVQRYDGDTYVIRQSVKTNFEGYIKLNKKVPAETLASFIFSSSDLQYWRKRTESESLAEKRW